MVVLVEVLGNWQVWALIDDVTPVLSKSVCQSTACLPNMQYQRAFGIK